MYRVCVECVGGAHRTHIAPCGAVGGSSRPAQTAINEHDFGYLGGRLIRLSCDRPAWHNVSPMSAHENGKKTKPEAKLLQAVDTCLEKLSDEEIADKIRATEKILADRAVKSRRASRPTPTTRPR